MTLLLPMLPGVAVLGGITASDLPTAEAATEMNPPFPELDTLLAYRRGRFHGHQVVEVLTGHVQLRASPPTARN
jgi:hypothetical protein